VAVKSKSAPKRTEAINFTNQWPVPCKVVPQIGPLTIPAAGAEIEVRVGYGDGPDACKYITVPDKPWLGTIPRISEFDLLVKPNPSRKARTAVVSVQGNMSRKIHKVRVRQLGRDA
jgi:hypothetical protein